MNSSNNDTNGAASIAVLSSYALLDLKLVVNFCNLRSYMLFLSLVGAKALLK